MMFWYALLGAFGVTAVQASSLRSEVTQALKGGLAIELGGKCIKSGLVFIGDPGSAGAADAANGWPGDSSGSCGGNSLSVYKSCLVATGLENTDWPYLTMPGCSTGNFRSCLKAAGYSSSSEANFDSAGDSACIIDNCAGKPTSTLSLGKQRVEVCCSNGVTIGKPDSFSHFGVDAVDGASHAVSCSGGTCTYKVACNCPSAKGDGVQDADHKETVKTVTAPCDGVVADSTADIVISPKCTSDNAKITIGSAIIGSAGAQSTSKKPSDDNFLPFGKLVLKPESDGCEASIGQVYIGNPGKIYE